MTHLTYNLTYNSRHITLIFDYFPGRVNNELEDEYDVEEVLFCEIQEDGLDIIADITEDEYLELYKIALEVAHSC